MTVYSFQGSKDDNNTVFTITDWTTDTSMDCDSDDADLGDFLGTLCKVLIEKGIIKGSVTSK